MKEVFSQLPFSPSLPKVRRTPQQALKEVTSKSGLGVYASADRLFRGAVFGRDSLEVADDLMYVKPKLVHQILLTVASLIGENHNQANEEEPGKIIHEYRTTVVDGKPLDKASRDFFDELSSRWGGDEHELAYYGSIDSTPLFIKTLSSYCQAYGLEILTEQVQLRSGKKESLIVILEDTIDWLTNHLDESKSGFIEYKPQNPLSFKVDYKPENPLNFKNHAWKDSEEFYIHANGELANHEMPISSIEVQSIAYDALVMAAEILPSRKKRLEKCAEELGNLVFRYLWMPDRNYFALGTDFDPQTGGLRTINTITANPAEMLDSAIFDRLGESEKKLYISGIVREIMGTAFLTDAGIRSRSLSEAKLVNHWDYHGSFVTWPKETFDIAKGQRRQHLPLLATELNNRLLNITRAAKSYPEFYYVDERGRVFGLPTSKRFHGKTIPIESRDKPERIQAWTVSAIIAILDQQRKAGLPVRRVEWRTELEQEVIRHIPHVPLLRTKKELGARYPEYPYEVRI